MEDIFDDDGYEEQSEPEGRDSMRGLPPDLWREEMHSLIHMAATYPEMVETDGRLLNIALSPNEVYLIKLGLHFVVALYPCLTDDCLNLDDRVEDLIDGQELA